MKTLETQVPAGTQVVSLLEVRGPNQSLVHPRGAVGVVTRTPSGEEELYLVRFPDGYEFSLRRDQLEILKHFKSRLANETGGAGVAAREFDLESLVLYRCVVGSRAYGLEQDDSDTDRRGVYQAPAEMHFSLFGAPEQFEDNASQSCYWELQKFLVMALKANPNMRRQTVFSSMHAVKRCFETESQDDSAARPRLHYGKIEN